MLGMLILTQTLVDGCPFWPYCVVLSHDIIYYLDSIWVCSDQQETHHGNSFEPTRYIHIYIWYKYRVYGNPKKIDKLDILHIMRLLDRPINSLILFFPYVFFLCGISKNTLSALVGCRSVAHRREHRSCRSLSVQHQWCSARHRRLPDFHAETQQPTFVGESVAGLPQDREFVHRIAVACWRLFMVTLHKGISMHIRGPQIDRTVWNQDVCRWYLAHNFQVWRFSIILYIYTRIFGACYNLAWQCVDLNLPHLISRGYKRANSKTSIERNSLA